MGDDEGSDDTSASKQTSAAGGRPAHRRVKLDAKKTTAAKPAPRPKVKLPFYRRGGFWFLVIVAEVLAALWLSYRFEPSTEYVDLAGADVTQFCATVTDVRAEVAGGTIEVANSVETFQDEQDAYRRLLPLAPTELRPDLEKLITGQAQMIETAREVQAKKAKDPSYLLGVSDIAAKQSELNERYRGPSLRLAAAVRQACNINVNEPVVPSTTTTFPGAPGAPGAPGSSAPGPVPGPVPGGDGSTTPPTTAGP